MWGPGFNVSRELLLAIRQSNQQRVLHLVEGLVGALRQQREASQAKATGGHAETLGTSCWDFACAVQRLSRLPLGEHQTDFWVEVTHVIRQNQSSLQPRELALFCNALAASPSVEAAQLLLHRALELQTELNARDFQMVLHGLSGCVPSTGAHPGFPDSASVASLAKAVRKVQLEKDRPLQAAQLLAAFVRLRHDSDAVLSKHMFDHALDTLPQWDAQSLTLLCTAIAGSRRAARAAVELAEGSEEAWQRIVLRLVELLPKAAPWQLASLARALMKVGASRTSVGPFYEALEQLLTSSNRSDLFSPTDLTFVVNGLAQHRCPQLQRLDAETLHLDKSVPMTSWEFEEYVGRKLHGFNSSELAVILHATMRLRRGGADFFDMLGAKLVAKDLTGTQLAHTFSASAAAAVFLVDLARPMRLLRPVLPTCALLAPSLTPWQLAYIAQALDVLAALRQRGLRGPYLWLHQNQASSLVEALCARAEKVVEDEAKYQQICEMLRRSDMICCCWVAWLEMGGSYRVLSADPAQLAISTVSQASFDHKYFDKFKGLSATLDNETNQIVLMNSIEEERAVSWARLADRLSETGWMELHVNTPKGAFFSNDLKMYGAGIVEGFLTAERMSQFYSNFYPLLQPNEDSALAMMNIRNSFNQQIQHIMHVCQLSAGTSEGEPADPYWKHVRYLFLQLWGLKDAYNLIAQEKGVRQIDMVDLLFINSHAELPELIQAFRPEAVAERSGAPSAESAPAALQNTPPGSLLEAQATQADASSVDTEWKLRLAKHGHCTALVRLAPANADLFVGHTTWSDYSKMTRVYKYYRFDLPLSFQSHELIGFSSYPGCVSSTDDFYMMDNGLAVMDTTLEVLNPKLYSRVMDDPKRPRLPKFLHVMAVNRVAKTGTQWTSMLAEENTGTGNSQWIVVDYNRFTPGQPLQRNAIRILEQVPGMTHQADITSELTSRGYWGSFNRPFFEDIREMSGHKTAEESYGKLFSFEDSPRASLLHRFGAGVSKLGDMRTTMTRNDPKDAVPGFPAGPGHAIMARLDLDAMVNNIPNGGIDAKVTSACLIKRMACQAMSGPSHGGYPAFRWTSQASGTSPSVELFQGWPHLGLPDVWDFDFVEMKSEEDQKASSQLSDSC
ncbi:plbC [Symbiodinium natans]|uniref:PlbC protein n=1 Tax=Symbiodinium natans TaxID=878477 RepID=A0A812TDV6_9DINO|nr:plbC [Symbiodinium natans]